MSRFSAVSHSKFKLAYTFLQKLNVALRQDMIHLSPTREKWLNHRDVFYLTAVMV